MENEQQQAFDLENYITISRHYESNDECKQYLKDQINRILKAKLLSGQKSHKLSIDEIAMIIEYKIAFALDNEGTIDDLYFYDYDTCQYSNKDNLLIRWIRSLGGTPSNATINTVKQWLRSSDNVLKPRELKTYEIPVKNGIYNMKDETLLENSIDLFVIKRLNVIYKPNIEYPDVDFNIMDFIKLITTDRIFFGIKQIMKRSILGYNPEHYIYLFLGSGGSGKSQIGKIIAEMTGEDNTSHLKLTDFDSFAQLNRLRDKFVNIGDDFNNADFVSGMDNLKIISAHGTLDVERKYKSSTSLQFTGPIIQCMAKMPRFAEVDEQLQRRLRVMTFNNQSEIKNHFKSEEEINKVIKNEDVKSWLFNELMSEELDVSLKDDNKQALNEIVKLNDTYGEFIASRQYTNLLTLDKIPSSVLRSIYLDDNNIKISSKSAISSAKFTSNIKDIMKDYGYEYVSNKTIRPKSAIGDVDVLRDINEDIDQLRESVGKDYVYQYDKSYGFEAFESIMNKNTPTAYFERIE